MDCEAGSAVVSWGPSGGAASYVAELEAASGRVASCATNRTSCEPSSVRCGEQYNVTVKAVGGACNSTTQMAGYLSSGALPRVRWFAFAVNAGGLWRSCLNV